MEGSNVARYTREDSKHVYSLVSELRTPLLELKLQSELSGNTQSVQVARQALALFDGFLYMNDQRLSGKQLDMLPCSLVAETKDAISGVEELATFYGITIRLKAARSAKPVALNRTAYKYATHGLLYAAVTSLQNSGGGQIDVTVSGGTNPRVQVRSDSFTKKAFSSKRVSDTTQKDSAPQFDGIGSGIVLAEELYELLDSKMVWTGRDSFYATFKHTKQMSLLGL